MKSGRLADPAGCHQQQQPGRRGAGGELEERWGGGADRPRGGGAGLTGPQRPMAAPGGRAGREPPLKGRCEREARPEAGGKEGDPGGRRGGEGGGERKRRRQKIKNKRLRLWRPLK